MNSRCIGLIAILSSATIAVPCQAQEGGLPFTGGIASDTELGRISGREDTQMAATAVQTAGVSSNTVGDHVETGEARIDGNAFQNMSGLSILNVNTGNNVAINAAMNVNISILPTQ